MTNIPEINDVRDAQRILSAPAGTYHPEVTISARLYVRNHYTKTNEELRNASLNFDANSGYSSNTDVYLSHCPLRRGTSTKVHLGRGRAISAIRLNAGSVWKLQDGTWVRIAYSYSQWDLDTGQMNPPLVHEEDRE